MNQRDTPHGQPNAGLPRDGERPGPTDGERSRVFDLLNERLRFENLLARLSTTFINLPAEDIDSRIELGLRQIVEFLGIERSGVAQFSEDGGQLLSTHIYTAPGFPPFPPANLVAILPWYSARIREGSVMRFCRLPDELPTEAVAERLYCLQSGLRSQLTIPLKVGEAILGGIGFASFRRYRDWPDDLVQSLQLVAEIFANAEARKRADTALRESESRFRRTADAAPVMIWVSGPDKLCTYLNKPWLDFTGRSLESQLGDGWSDCVHPDDLTHCLHTYESAFDARQEFRMEYRLRRFDGEYRWILDSGMPRFESGGAFSGYVGSCLDITDRMRAEEALRQSEARLRFLLESTQAIPWVADATTWQFTYVGPQARGLLGYPVEAWFERDFWFRHLHPEDRDAAVAYCLEHSQGHTDYTFDYRMVAADGRPVWIHDVVNVVTENGKPRLLRGFLIDVTARRQAEEESRRLREQLARAGRVSLMGELVASIAHEVNQPLCAIVGNALAVQRMLDSGGFDADEVRGALGDIVQDGQRASAVIARVRGLLQKAPAKRAPLDVNVLIHEMAALARGDLSRRGIRLRLVLAEGLPRVLTDGVQLQQVILNLLTNAAEAMDGVSRESRELTARSEMDGGGVAVSVRDTGTGIEPCRLDQIFDILYTTKPGGMGMGLALCKSIIEEHGGTISAAPNGGPGTTFRFTLPGTPEGTP
jgi:PAS domain S-box-containing protein